MPRKPLEFHAFPLRLAAEAPYGPYRAVIRHLVDGDTLDVFADLGFLRYAYLTIRLRGIDVPERDTPAGQAALAFLHATAPPGTACVILPYKDAVTFGRYVADVYTMTPDVGPVSLAAALHAAGHVKAVDSPRPTP